VSSAPAKPTKTSSEESNRPPLGRLAWIVARTGVGTFGSGNTTSVVLARELEERNWFGPAQFDLCFTIARAVPGTNLFAYIAAVGWSLRGWPGAIVAVAALSIPASAVVVLLTLAYQAWHTHPLGKSAIEAAMACIVGVMAAGAWWLVKPRARSVRTAILVLGGLILSRYLSPVLVMALAALAGYLWQEQS
jgi:chromate transporter